MIRSHDILKRSEQEREGLQVVDVEPARSNGQVAAGPIPVNPDPESASTASSRPMPSPTPLSFDAILAHCTQTTWKPDPQSVLFLGGQGEARGTEEFRALRSRLYQLREKQRLKTLLIASSVPKEGRSFVAVNLAKVLALQPECKVLLIDADLRAPRLHSVFGTSMTPGLTEYMLDEVGEIEAMQKGSAESLFLVPAGRSVSGPTELIANGRLKTMIKRVEHLFDWIILDSPSALPVSDACLLADCTDGVLLVVRSNSTPFDVVRKAREKFRDEQLVGAVLNGIEIRSSGQTHYDYAVSYPVAG